MEFATGVLAVDDSVPWNFDFNTVHYYGAWVFGTLFVLHACIKLPVVRRAYRERGVLKPLMQGVAQTKPEPPDDGGLAPINPAAPTISRRGLLAMVGGASLTIFAVQVGESIGGPFRRLALLAPRGRVFGTGPNDFPVTHTAASAEITPAMTGPDWRLDRRRRTNHLLQPRAATRDGPVHPHPDDHLHRRLVDDPALDRRAARRVGPTRGCARGGDPPRGNAPAANWSPAL